MLRSLHVAPAGRRGIGPWAGTGAWAVAAWLTGAVAFAQSVGGERPTSPGAAVATAASPVRASAGAAASVSAPASAAAHAAGLAYRRDGQLAMAVAAFESARDHAADAAQRQRAVAELGATLVQARQYERADAALTEAFAAAQGPARAAVAVDLGNLAAMRGRTAQARARYDEALAAAGADAALVYAARLNLARLQPPPARLAALNALLPLVDAEPAALRRAPRQLALAQQARRLGEPGMALAYTQFDAARRTADAAGDARLLAEALDGLAQLYEQRGRRGEAQALNARALDAAARLPAGAIGDLRVQLEWREARLARDLGRPAAALAAWQRAVRQVETLRQDIPIDDDNGDSSFRALLEPVYLGLVEALLGAADAAAPAQRAELLRQVVDTVELVRQTELQDYLGDRCDVDAVKGDSATVLPAGVAVLYPIVLADRLELLVETADGVQRHRSEVPASQVRETAQRFAGQLRSGRRGYLPDAGRLYDWVLRPLEPALAAARTDTLVVVPDGALRLVAVGAFHDGSRYAIEKYAIATATGMTMTNTSRATPRGRRGVLLAGLSTPGPVVGKLSPKTVERLLGPQAAQSIERQAGAARSGAGAAAGPGAADGATPAGTSGTPGDAAAGPGATGAVPPAGAASPAGGAAQGEAAAEDARTRALREALALPGVAVEVEAIARIAPHTGLLDERFTVEAFRDAAESGDYRIIHVASHGVFGGSAEASYVLAYDDLLTLDGLQSLLRSDSFRRNPVELLSLSACETAEGDERSPLGMSGAAIKARAKAVMGSLWPVADDAAVKLMAGFYDRLLREGRSKAEALREAQIALLRSREFAHPFYWAPFILIGNWL